MAAKARRPIAKKRGRQKRRGSTVGVIGRIIRSVTGGTSVARSAASRSDAKMIQERQRQSAGAGIRRRRLKDL